MRRITATLAVAVAISTAGVAGAVPAMAASHTAKPGTTTTSYYLSLGDSLAQGVQPNSAGVSVETNYGYANQLESALRETNPTLHLVKLGCPGETTASMIKGGICTYSAGSQLAQAVAFLKHHASQTQLVTIDIGANDVLPCTAEPNLTKIVKCLETAIPAALTNLGEIMTQLRAADPTGMTLAMSYYDPILSVWLKGTKSAQTLASDSVALTEAFNKDLLGVYKKFSTPMANVYGAFKTSDLTDMVTTPAFGSVPLDVATVCSYTWECAAPPAGPNVHANVLGYGIIANAFLQRYLALTKAS